MTAPRGADAAHERHARALRVLDDQATPSVQAAINAMLAAALDANSGVPSSDELESAARRGWRGAVDRITAWVRAAMRRLLGQAQDNLPDTFPPLDERTLEQRVDALAAQVADALVDVPDLVAARTVTALREGYERGESPAQLQARVAEVLGVDEWLPEVARIVRTTTTAVYNAAHTAAADALERTLGRPLPRMWIATLDQRVRPTHRKAHLQVVESGERFAVGDAQLRFPGDPLGPPEEIIMCRCTVVAVVDDVVIDLARTLTDTEEALMQPEGDTTADGPPDTAAQGSRYAAALVALPTRMPPALVRYWSREIDFGSPGSFRTCQRRLREHLPPGQVDGACANLYRLNTGQWPGRQKGEATVDEQTATPPDTPDTPDADDPDGSVVAVTLDEVHNLAMVALVPSDADAARLAVTGEGAIPADQLHVTMLALGDVDAWQDPDTVAALHDTVAQAAAMLAPITGRLWGRVEINPGTEEPVSAYLVGDDTGTLGAAQAAMVVATTGMPIPEQHEPYVPHLSVRYGPGDLSALGETGGEVLLDRLRVSLGDEVTDHPLTGTGAVETVMPMDDEVVDSPADMDDDMAAATAAARVAVDPTVGMDPDRPVTAITAAAIAAAGDVRDVVAAAVAAAPDAPPGAWFEPVDVDGPTPPTVTAEGRVWGHIGQAGVCHQGIAEECVLIPPTRTSYGAFHRDRVVTAEGDTVAVGYLYTGCDHSPLGSSMDEARDYLDASCARAARGRVYDTEWGPMFVGALVPGVTADDVHQLYKLSGEWFPAPLEFHAAVGVREAGYPVDGTGDDIRVAETAPASGPAFDPARRDAVAASAVDVAAMAAAVVDVIEERAAQRADEQRRRLVAARASAAVITRYQSTRS